MARRRESQDERQTKAGLGRTDRASDDEPRTTRPGPTDAGRAIGLQGQHVVDAHEPNLGHPERRAPDEGAPEGAVRPEDLPSRRVREDEGAR